MFTCTTKADNHQQSVHYKNPTTQEKCVFVRIWNWEFSLKSRMKCTQNVEKADRMQYKCLHRKSNWHNRQKCVMIGLCLQYLWYFPYKKTKNKTLNQNKTFTFIRSIYFYLDHNNVYTFLYVLYLKCLYFPFRSNIIHLLTIPCTEPFSIWFWP